MLARDPPERGSGVMWCSSRAIRSLLHCGTLNPNPIQPHPTPPRRSTNPHAFPSNTPASPRNHPTSRPCHSVCGTVTCCTCCWAGLHPTWTPNKSWSIRQRRRMRPQAPPAAQQPWPLPPPPRSCSAALCAAHGLPGSPGLPPSALAGQAAPWLLTLPSSMRL